MSFSESILTTNTCHILIVEDHELSAQIVGRFLNQLNCTYDWASTGEIGLEYYKQNFYDLVLVDIGLPQMNGYELVKEIRGTSAFKTYSTPIVALTALDDEKSKRTCLEIGMNAAFSKPLLRTTTREILEAFVPKWHAVEARLDSKKTLNELNLTGEPIQFEQVLMLYDQDMRFVKNALAIVIENFRSEQEKINEAYRKRNWGAIGAITHKIHGAARYFGMARLEQICVYFSQMIKKYSEITENDYQLLFNEIAEIGASYQRWLKDQKI